MGFFRSVITLAAVVLCVAFAYFFGHGLAAHHTKPLIFGAVLLALGGALIALLSRDRVRGNW
jgi:hypothetical protein